MLYELRIYHAVPGHLPDLRQGVHRVTAAGSPSAM